MRIIYEILTDFYLTARMPIQFLDDDLTVVKSLGDAIFPVWDVKTDGSNLNAISSFETTDGLRYIVLPFNEKNHSTGYFLVGPYQDFDALNTDICFRPAALSPYFEELLISIVKRNIANCVEANPHIAKGIKFIHENFHEPINLHVLCEHLNLNMCYFCVLFKNQTSMTFSQYLNRLRINESKKLLEETDQSIIDISLAVGFNNHNHFGATFKKLTGLTPTRYRQQMKK